MKAQQTVFSMESCCCNDTVDDSASGSSFSQTGSNCTSNSICVAEQMMFGCMCAETLQVCSCIKSQHQAMHESELLEVKECADLNTDVSPSSLGEVTEHANQPMFAVSFDSELSYSSCANESLEKTVSLSKPAGSVSAGCSTFLSSHSSDGGICDNQLSSDGICTECLF
jgi:hypothetical protein